MADPVRSARKALARGATTEALVHLWNGLEPARIAGDTSRLNAIAGLAQRVREQGEESDAREADRLLDAVRGTAEREGGVPATERIEATVAAGGEPLEEFGPDEEGSRAGRFGNLIWLVLVVLVVLFNLIGQLRDGG